MIPDHCIKERIYDLYIYMKSDNCHSDSIVFKNYTDFTIKEYITAILNDNNYLQHLIKKNKNTDKFIFKYNDDYLLIYFKEYIVNTIEFHIEIFNNLNHAINYYNQM